jgi:hypothetical protein
LTIKLSIPMLLAPLILAGLRPRALCNWATLTAAFLLLFSVTFRVQIGIRMVLPLITLWIVGVAGAAANTVAALEQVWKKRLAVAATAGCVLWTTAAAVHVWPQGLCYTNDLWGGTDVGYYRLSDSNYDWGQGLKELVGWQEQHGINNLKLWYFGPATLIHKGPYQLEPLHEIAFHGPEEVLARLRGHYLAVSTTILYGSYFMEHPKKPGPLQQSNMIVVRLLRAGRPVDRTTTFLIYDFTDVPESP